MRSLSQSSRQDRHPGGKSRGAGGYIPQLVGICVIAVALFLTSASAWADRGQTAETLSQVKRIYVGSLGTKQGASSLRAKLILRLRKARGIEVVASPSEADAIITGTGEVWLIGYISTNPKLSPYNRQPVYDGYLLVELKGKNDNTLWSCRATPGRFLWNGVPQDLVNRLTNRLLASLHQPGGST
jgi:hypothetical protein